MTEIQSSPRHMVLGAVLSPTSTHIGGWRHPNAVPNAAMSLKDACGFAAMAEQAKLDFVFMADELCAPDAEVDVLSRDPVIYRFEPLTLTAALAAVTKRIGLIVTQTTTYNEPYHVARKLASIDHLSEGRSGWNLVTSYVTAEAANFGSSKHASNAERYARAEEFLHVAQGLWDSWGDDAFVLDKENGRYFNPESMHVLAHQGESFSVRGPLNIVRPPQGRPVQVQAGSSPAGIRLAARHAEVVFTAQDTLEKALAFSAELRSQTLHEGRAAESVRILAGAVPVIGKSEQEASDKAAELQGLIHPEVGLTRLSQLLGFDVTQLPLDSYLPTDIPSTEAYKSRQQLIVDLARREQLTLGELYPRVVATYGHRTIVGTPTQVADALEEWFVAGAVDGYMIAPMFLPDSLDDFTRLVVPELRRRGLFRNEYEGHTLRDHLKLPRPCRGEGTDR